MADLEGDPSERGAPTYCVHGCCTQYPLLNPDLATITIINATLMHSFIKRIKQIPGSLV